MTKHNNKVRKSLDEILLSTGADESLLELIKSGSRRRNLTEYKLAYAKEAPKQIERMPEFKELVTRRWTIAVILTVMVFITYYGFVLVVGMSKSTLSQKIGTVTTLGIPVAIAVIVISFILTVMYVLWANTRYDSMSAQILSKARGK